MTAMLREMPNTQQVAGEPRRIWYFCHDLDLVVWFDEDDAPCAFQLAYDKYRGEHSIAWDATKGYRHYRVDDGEGAGFSSQTPFLYANGPFQRDPVLEQFIALSAELPVAVVELVTGKLREFAGPLDS